MHYKLTKQISAKKKIPGAPIYTFLIGLFVIPVIVIAFASLFVYNILLWIKQLFLKKKTPSLAEPYFLELDLLTSEYIKITVVEDEADAELNSLNEWWTGRAYHDQTYLYRAKTKPFLSAIDGRIIGFYLKEQPGGVILQLLPEKEPGIEPSATQLIYLQYSDLRIIPIDEIGLFHLYNDEVDPDLIRGFNDEEEIKIYLNRMEDS